jgi:hypothetical protein
MGKMIGTLVGVGVTLIVALYPTKKCFETTQWKHFMGEGDY